MPRSLIRNLFLRLLGLIFFSAFLSLLWQIDELAKRAVVVADVLLPGGLDAGQDAHGAEREI